ncbi:SDR family oxidoreductase [Zunongwangia profunda]|uniref:SDR family oxidoreductase n=1 Tax=Zunongwangia profunda TaxID=398743 RepID=UPI0032B2412A|tara:strand:- start:3314 stop:4054 length:741 start_codon:yes stop_codon:yes gene_type:complete
MMRSVLITGANKSIGFELAKMMLQNDYFVFLGSRNKERGEDAVAILKESGLDQVQLVQLDVTNQDSINAAVATVKQRFGKLDILVNNAGILGGWDQKAVSVKTQVIREVFDTNFFGVINVTQAFLDLLRKSERPRINNITSGLGSLTLHTNPDWDHYDVKTGAYGPSKTALNAYSVVLAYELKDDNFKVNVIDPGYTATDFNDHQGGLSVEDSARFLYDHIDLPEDGRNSAYFSHEINEAPHVSPW